MKHQWVGLGTRSAWWCATHDDWQIKERFRALCFSPENKCINEKKKSLINTCLKVKEPVLNNSNLFWLYLTLVGIPTHHRKTPLDRKQPQETDERCPLIKSHTYTSTRTATKNKSRKITVLKDYHIIQNCHWYCAKTEQHNRNPLFWFVEMWSLLRSNLTTSLYVIHAMLTSYLTPSWNKHRSTSVVSNTLTRTILAGHPAKAGKQPLARASAQPSLILHTSTLSKYL